MSGVKIDIATESGSTSEQLRDINRHLANIVRNTNLSSNALGGMKTGQLKNINAHTKEVSSNFSKMGTAATQNFPKIDQAAKKSGSALISMRNILVSLAAGFVAFKGINVFNKAADDLVKVQNRLKLVEKDTRNLIKAQEQLYRISQNTASNFENSADIYAKFTKALEADGGVSRRVVLNVTRTLNQASTLSGTSIEGIKGAILQLNQGISSGTLRGEELNSVLEQLPYLGFELQRSLGMSTGALRKFAEEGKLTSRIVLKVLTDMGEKTAKDFADITWTVEMAFNKLVTSLSYNMGNLNQSLGVSSKLANRLSLIADGMDQLRIDVTADLVAMDLAIENFKKKLDRFSSIGLVLEGIVALELYTPEKIFNASDFYKEMAGIKAIFEEYTKEVESKGLLKAKIDFELIGNAISGKIDAKSYKEALEEKRKETEAASKFSEKITLAKNIFTGEIFKEAETGLSKLGSSLFFVYETSKSLFLILKDLGYAISAYVLPPLQLLPKIMTEVTRYLATRAVFIADTYYGVANSINSLFEAINPFLLGKNIERAFVDIFRAEGLSDLTARIRIFNRELKEGPTNNYLRPLSTMFRPDSGLLKDIYNIGRSIGLFEYTLISWASISPKVIQIGLQVISNSFRMLYDQILAPRIVPRLIQLLAQLQAFSSSVSTLLINSFNAEYGKIFADALIRGVKIAFASAGRVIKNLYDDLLATLTRATGSAIIVDLVEVIKSFYKFFKSFAKTIGEELSNQIVIAFNRLSNIVANTLKTIVNNLSSNLRRFFGGVKNEITLDLSFNMEDSKEKLEDFFSSLTGLDLTDTLNSIRNFTQGAIEYFRELYDRVIGNSYWTDTISSIKDSTGTLDEVAEDVGRFINKLIGKFKSLSAKIIPGINSLIEILKRAFSDGFRYLSDTVWKNFELALFGGLLYLISGDKIRTIVKTVFSVLAIEAAASAFPSAAETIGTKFASLLIDSLKLATDVFIPKLTAFIQQLPQIVNSLLSGLGPIGATIDFLIPDNNLLYASLLGAILFMWKAEKGLETIGNILFGQFEKLKNGTKKLQSSGFIHYLSDFFTRLRDTLGWNLARNNIGPARPPLLLSPALMTAAVLATITAFTDAISAMDAAFLAIPLAIYSILGMQGGNRFFVDLLVNVFVKPFTAALGIIAGLLQHNFTQMIFGAIFGRQAARIFGLANWVRGLFAAQRTSAVRAFVGETRILYDNFLKNRNAYSKGRISLLDSVFDARNTRRRALPIFDKMRADFPQLKTAIIDAFNSIMDVTRNAWTAMKAGWTAAIEAIRARFLSLQTTIAGIWATTAGKFAIAFAAVFSLSLAFSGTAKAASGLNSEVSNLSSITDFIGPILITLATLRGSLGLLYALFTNPTALLAGMVKLKTLIIGLPLQIAGAFTTLSVANATTVAASKAVWSSLFTFLFKGFNSVFTIGIGLYGISKLTNSTAESIGGLGEAFIKTSASLGIFVAQMIAVIAAFKLVNAFRGGRRKYLEELTANNLAAAGGTPGRRRRSRVNEFMGAGSIVAGFREVGSSFRNLGTVLGDSAASLKKPFTESAAAAQRSWGRGGRISAGLIYITKLFWEMSKAIMYATYSLLAAIPIIDLAIMALALPVKALRGMWRSVIDQLRETGLAGLGVGAKMRAVGRAIKLAWIPIGIAMKWVLGIALGAIVAGGIFTAVLFGTQGEVGFKATFNYWYDRIKMLLGLAPTSGKGRLFDLMKSVRPREFGDNTVDLNKFLVNIDLEKLSKSSYASLKRAVDEVGETFNRLEDDATRQGGVLTAEQQKEFDDTRTRAIRMFDKQPQIDVDIGPFQKQMSEILMDVDNSLAARTKRFLGLDASVYFTPEGAGALRKSIDFTVVAFSNFKEGIGNVTSFLFGWLDIFSPAMEGMVWAATKVSDGFLSVYNYLKKKFFDETEEVPLRENVIKADFFKELFAPLEKNKALLTEPENTLLETLLNNFQASQASVAEMIRNGFTYAEKQRQVGYTPEVRRDDGTIETPASYTKSGQELFTDRLNRAQADLRYLEQNMIDVVIRLSYETELRKASQDIAEKLTQEAEKIKGTFGIDSGTDFSKSTLSFLEIDNLLNLSRKYEKYSLGVKNAYSEKERFFYYSKLGNLQREADGIDELSKKFGTLKGEMDSLTEFFKVFGTEFFRQNRSSAGLEFGDFTDDVKELIKLRKRLEDMDSTPEFFDSKEYRAANTQIDRLTTRIFKTLREAPTPSKLGINESLKALELKPFELDVKLSENSKEALRQALVDYKEQLDISETTTNSPVTREEAAINARILFEKIKTIQTQINLDAAFNVEDNTILRLKSLKDIFDQEIPAAIFKSVEAANNWANATGLIIQKQEELKAAYSAGEFDQVKALSNDLLKLELSKTVAEAAVNDKSLVDAFSNLGIDLPPEDFKKITEDVRQKIIEAGIVESSDLITLDAKLAIKADIESIAFGEATNFVINSIESLDSAFSNLGVDSAKLGNYSEKSIEEINKLNKAFINATRQKALFLRKGDYAGVESAQKILDGVAKSAEKFGNAMEDIKGTIGSVLDLELDDMGFLTLPEKVRGSLFSAAKYFENGLKNFDSKNGNKFFDEFASYKNSAKIYTFMSKLATKSSEILKGGIRNAFEIVSKSLPEMDLESFLTLPDEFSRNIANSLSDNNLLKDFLLDVNLNDDQLAQFQALLDKGLSGKAVLDELQLDFPDLRSEAQQQTDELVSASEKLINSNYDLALNIQNLDTTVAKYAGVMENITVPDFTAFRQVFKNQKKFELTFDPYEDLRVLPKKPDSSKVKSESIDKIDEVAFDNFSASLDIYNELKANATALGETRGKILEGISKKQGGLTRAADISDADRAAKNKATENQIEALSKVDGEFGDLKRALKELFQDENLADRARALAEKESISLDLALYRSLSEGAFNARTEEEKARYKAFAEFLAKDSKLAVGNEKQARDQLTDMDKLIADNLDAVKKAFTNLAKDTTFFELASRDNRFGPQSLSTVIETKDGATVNIGEDSIKTQIKPFIDAFRPLLGYNKTLIEAVEDRIAGDISQGKIYGNTKETSGIIDVEYLRKIFSDIPQLANYVKDLDPLFSEIAKTSDILRVGETTNAALVTSNKYLADIDLALKLTANTIAEGTFLEEQNARRLENVIRSSFTRREVDSATQNYIPLGAIPPSFPGGVVGWATGGYITGPGGPTSDLIPALLSNQEFVVNAASTKKFRPLLESINNGSYRGFYKGTSAGTAEIEGKIEKLVIDLRWPEDFKRYMKAIILQESSYDSGAVNPNGGASGFFQFTGQSARRLNTTLEEIRKMDFDQQVVLFKEYLQMHNITADKMERFVDAVLVFTAPSMIGASEGTTVYKQGSEEYKANPYWDLDKVNGITVEEFDKFYSRKLKSLPPEDTTSEEPPKLPTVGSTYAKLNLKELTDTWMAIAAIEDPVFKLKNAFASLKINLDSEMIETFGESNIKMLFAMSEAVKDQLANVYKRTNEGAEPEELMKLNKALRESKKEIDKMVKALTDLQNKGKAFNDNFFGILQEGMSGLLTGDIEDYGDFGRGLLDKFTKGVVDDFLEGFMQPIKDTDALKGVGVQMASLANTFGEKVAGWLTGVSTPMAAPSMGESTKSEKSGLFSDWKKTADASVAGSAEAICACMKGGGGGGAYPGSNADIFSKDAGKEAPLGASTDMFGVLADGLKDSEAPIKEASEGLVETTSTSLGGVFSKVKEGIGALAQNIGGEISAVIGHVIVGITAILNIIKLLPAAAGGGKIVGGGSGTSDSILARVSNGEFIVNAKSTKKFSPILEAINSGDYLKGMKGFAMGGVVGASVLAMPIALSSELATAPKNQQIINMNITGDISRQTKAEIYKMLPQIASGVNSVNHNRGSYH